MKQSTILKRLRHITLHSQGLLQSHPFGRDKYAVQSAIEHLGYIQIDTLSVVERAHHHTLWTRLPDYKPEYLDQLVAERKIFEYWSHAASYLPMRDFRFALPQMLQYKTGETQFYNQADPVLMNQVLDRIRIDGPLKARDFVAPKSRPGSWWNWNPAKIALEQLFMQGDLMICGRGGMEKIYDLTERVLPDSVDTAVPGPMEFADYLVESHLKAFGACTIKQITHLRAGKSLRQNVEQVLQNLIETNTVRQIKLEGIPVLYVLSKYLESPVKKTRPAVKILSPFDNSIIHREKVIQLFDFDYRIECYTPKEKRQFGYFCLPILYEDAFIGRLDCKAHRKNGIFEIIHLHIESRQNEFEKWSDLLMVQIQEFATFNGCQSIKLTRVSPDSMLNTIKLLLAL